MLRLRTAKVDVRGAGGAVGPTREVFHRDLRQLEEGVVALAVRVKDAIAKAVRALADRDGALAREVMAGDRAIDEQEMELEHRCLTLLALQQPVASDLRAIGAGLRILIDLERIADHAADIARVAARLEGQELVKPLIDIPRMASLAQDMVARAVDAYVARDEAAARSVAASDDEVDHLFSQVFRELLAIMVQDSRTVDQATHLLLVASHLERVADHATNVAEAVIYAVTGQRPELND